MNFTTLLELLGTFAFAVSGMRLASGKRIDWFGAYIVGLVTAIGGGTMRDLLLDVTPFWMLDAKYFLTTGVALIAILMFKDKIFKLGGTLFLFDAVGLGLIYNNWHCQKHGCRVPHLGLYCYGYHYRFSGRGGARCVAKRSSSDFPKRYLRAHLCGGWRRIFSLYLF